MLTATFILILSCAAFALWTKDSELRFRLSISAPQQGGGDCGGCEDYSSIPEGIQLIRDMYERIFNRMEEFSRQLEVRLAEINAMPFGSMTYPQLQEECARYRNVDIAGFGNCINKFGNCINKLADFFNRLPNNEKEAYPDFWDQHRALWDLHRQLWNRREDLYVQVQDIWEAGEKKINTGNKK